MELENRLLWLRQHGALQEKRAYEKQDVDYWGLAVPL